MSPNFQFAHILLGSVPDGIVKIDVRLEEETAWLSQAQMAELFGKSRTTITEQIQNVYKEGELDESSVGRNFRHTAEMGKAMTPITTILTL